MHKSINQCTVHINYTYNENNIIPVLFRNPSQISFIGPNFAPYIVKLRYEKKINESK